MAGPPGLYTELPNLLHYETNSTARGDIRDVMSVGKLIRKGDGPQEAVRTCCPYSSIITFDIACESLIIRLIRYCGACPVCSGKLIAEVFN